VSTALRLSNNELRSFKSSEQLRESLASVVFMPHKLLWLDLSFNMFTEVRCIAQACPSLKLLYLHANQIEDTAEIDSLSGLTQLKTLTLHGNPVENATAPAYRYRVVAALPTLRQL
jgi:Leucine-rich repeat (LRR) protein